MRIVLKPLAPAAERAFQIHYAKVMLNEARARRGFNAMHVNLLSYAASGRRRAAEAGKLIEPDLFGKPAALAGELRRVG